MPEEFLDETDVVTFDERIESFRSLSFHILSAMQMESKRMKKAQVVFIWLSCNASNVILSIVWFLDRDLGKMRSANTVKFVN